MDLVGYLRSYSSEKHHSGDNYMHRRLVREIARDISKILKYDSGVEVQVFLEVDLQKNNRFYGTADVVAVSDTQLSVIEARILRGKRFDNVKTEVNNQLKEAYEFFKVNFGIAPRMIRVIKPVESNHPDVDELKREITDYKIWEFSH
jgi:hypothetical protein